MVEQLTWDTQADWDAAQAREGVITRDVGVHTGDTIALGFDPQYLPSGLVGYWSMDDSGTTLTEEINGYDASLFNASTGHTGPLSTNAVNFDGDGDEADVDAGTDPAGSGNFTVACWVDKDSVSGEDTMFRSGTTTDGTYFFDYRSDGRLGFGYYGDPDLNYDTSFHGGDSLLGQEFLVGVADVGNELRVYHDGVADTFSVSASRPATNSPDFRIGRSANSSAPRHFNGDIGLVMLWDRELSEDEVLDLYDIFGSGSLTTATQTIDGEAIEVTASASVPSGTAVDLTVCQDVSGDGTPDHQQTVSLADGTATYALDAFERTDSDYWVQYDLSSTEETVTPTVQSTTVDVETVVPLEVGISGTASGTASTAVNLTPILDLGLQADFASSAALDITRAVEPRLNASATTTTDIGVQVGPRPSINATGTSDAGIGLTRDRATTLDAAATSAADAALAIANLQNIQFSASASSEANGTLRQGWFVGLATSGTATGSGEMFMRRAVGVPGEAGGDLSLPLVNTFGDKLDHTAFPIETAVPWRAARLLGTVNWKHDSITARIARNLPGGSVEHAAKSEFVNVGAVSISAPTASASATAHTPPIITPSALITATTATARGIGYSPAVTATSPPSGLDPGETLTIDAGTTYEDESPFANAGTVANAGTFDLTPENDN